MLGFHLHFVAAFGAITADTPWDIHTYIHVEIALYIYGTVNVSLIALGFFFFGKYNSFIYGVSLTS